jgi:hypothetical protein
MYRKNHGCRKEREAHLRGMLSHEEWRFVDAGAAMASITITRYGGFAARLEGD